MQITQTLSPKNRSEWRKWLEENSKIEKEIWLLLERNKTPSLTYLDAVEEALCFGWIDGIVKVYSDEYRAQRFSPRRPGGNWTELNKERCRRLAKLGLMTPAGLEVIPTLYDEFIIPESIQTALQNDQVVWENFNKFHPLYQRVKIGYLKELLKNKKFEDYESRLKKLIDQTRLGKMFGDWNDGGRLIDY